MKIPTIQEIPQRLKKFRNDHHLSQEDVAKMLDVSATSIIYWEQGKKIKNIRYHNAMKLFDLLVSYDSPPPPSLPTNKLAAVQSPTPTESPPCATCQVSQTVAKG